MSFTRSIKKLFRPWRAVVLMYHRIAEPEMDPWQLAVSRNNFKEHLEILAATGKVISTDELINNIRTKKLDADCFCITSDDGYQDNYINAFPLIEEYACPSTFFIASGSIGSGEPYWWDMMTDIFLSTKKLPETLDISIGSTQFAYTLETNGKINAEQLKKHRAWHWPQSPPTQRCQIYLELWMHLRDQPSMLIRETMRKLVRWSGVAAINDSGSYPMSRQELLEMSTGKYINTGVHTITHAALGAFSRQIQQTEIKGCKEYLDDNLDKEHSSIAFPYGNFNRDTLEVVKQVGLKGAFTTDPKPVTIKSDVYQLGRFQVINQTGEQFKKQLDHWLNN
jgi:peptidoglycan/xylan/chitin deacetylase (PgdA/CDA1 family)